MNTGSKDTQEQFDFICLNPRKAKRRKVTETLRGLGPIRWISIAPMRLRSWPETNAQAQKARAMSKERKRGAISEWLTNTLLRLQYNGTRAFFERNPLSVAVCWNGLNGTRRVFMDAAHDAGARTLFFELGPLPGRITVDPHGVNFANSLPRNIGPYLAWAQAHKPEPDIWRSAGRDIRQRASASQKEQHGNLPSLDAPFLFVPLQTPGDSQLRLFGGAFPTVEGFIKALIEASANLPDGWHLRVKEHPTAPTSFSDLFAAADDRPIYLDNATDTFEQVAAAHGVITVNSSVGLEAMFYDKPIVACGQCFWAIPGVAQGAPTSEALNDICAKPNDLTFDPEMRNAFMNFLTQCYYPDGNQSSTLIAQRLHGSDTFGFWGDQE